uniref:Abhydro_lipase domain-containing protein n=1 Tax=Toxocara canis TaxID=6265 RepID=A0A183U260_TOXCA
LLSHSTIQVEIIAHYGYTAEVVNVQTEDGYILQMHRIPYGRNESFEVFKRKRPVVFFQHGLLASSADWVTNTPNLSAAFLFADAGFDVWMGNVRGNVYSKEHRTYSSSDKAYWQFSWDEMSKYDLDAMINKVLNVTKQSDLYYIGHSQGTLTMFTKLASDQQFASKIRKFFALAPIGTVAHIKGLLYYLAKIFLKLPFIEKALGSKDFLPNTWLTKLFGRYICGIYYINPVCDSVLFQIGGPENQFNKSRLPVYLSHSPAGTSAQNILHWTQMIKSGKTQAYDYGSEKENLIHYGQPSAPLYNLGRVNTPVYLFWSDKDWLADEIDIKVI